MDDVKSKLSAEFAVKDLGDLQYLLGVSITQNSTEKSVWIGQSVYTLNVLEKFGLKDAKPVAILVCVSSKLTIYSFTFCFETDVILDFINN